MSLALASLRVAGGTDWSQAGLSPVYLSVTAALLVLGAGLAAGSGLWPANPGSRLAPGLAVLVVVVGALVTGPLATAGGLFRTTAVVLVLGASVAVLWFLARSGGLPDRLARWRERHAPPVGVAAGPIQRPEAALLTAHLLCAVAALAAPHFVLVAAAVAGAALTGLALARWRRRGGRPAGLVLAGVVLLIVSAAVLQVAGETSLRLRALGQGPFSPAFEPFAALGLLLAAWPLLRLWPFRMEELGPFTPLAASALVGRLAVAMAPAGVEHWQPLLFPLLLVATWIGAIAGDWSQAIRAVAVTGLASLRPGAAVAAVVLLAGEGLLALVAGRVPPRLARVVGIGVAGLSAVALVPLFAGALQAQTFYTVLLAASLAVVLANAVPEVSPRVAR